jgi:hypothetical protein
LRVWRERTAAIRTFLPVDAEPVKVFDHGVDELPATALRIEILNAKN